MADIKKRTPTKTPIYLTYESADLIPGTSKKYLQAPDKFIMFVGNTPPYKNIERLIEAMPEMNKKTGAKLLLVGKENPYTNSLKRIAEEKAEDLVRWTGFVSDSQLKWLYENTACCVAPSLAEGFGLPGLEAIAHGSPVAASNNTCMPEIYGEAATYFNPYDVQEIAEVVSEVVNNESLQKKLAKEGVSQTKKYSWQDCAQQTLGVYKKVLGID